MNDDRLLITDGVHTENTEGNGGPQADDGEERELKRINRELKEDNFASWMICEPNENEGKKLLEEIMKGGNFGQYDTRDAALKKGGMVKHGVWKLKRVIVVFTRHNCRLYTVGIKVWQITIYLCLRYSTEFESGVHNAFFNISIKEGNSHEKV